MNIQRFRQVLAYIEAHPEEWNQFRDTDEPAPRCFGCIAASLFGVGDGCFADEKMVLALECSPEMALWLYNPARTLDDFRTVARRPCA
jgi:hypothetical protein